MACCAARFQNRAGMSNWKPVVLASVTVGLAVLGLTGSGVAERPELMLRDALMHARAPRPSSAVAVVAIDDASIRALGRWPWPRERLAELVDGARAAGATSVAVDILLIDPAPGDDVLAEALDASGGLIVVGFDQATGALLPSATLRGRANLAHGVLELDGDGVLRRLASTKQDPSGSYPAMSVAIASRVSGDDRIPVGREIIPAFTVRPDSVPFVSAESLLAGGGQPRLEGRAVVVGVSATGLGDRVVTPVTRTGQLDAGVLVHAAAAESIARGDVVTVLPPWVAAIAAACLVLAAGAASRLGGSSRLAAVVGILALPLSTGAGAFLSRNLASPTILLTLVAAGSVLAAESRTLLAVSRGVGRAAGALGGGEEPSSPEERVRHLEALAASISRERREAGESQRVVAHELRTPLTSIRGLAQLLAAYDLSDGERRRVAGMVAEESARLHEMVEGLLDLERLTLRDRATATKRVDLASILAKRGALARAAGRQAIAVDCDEALAVDCDEALAVDGDPELLERMIENLVGNAMKFAPDASTITIRGIRSEDGLVVEVADEGPGIPPGEREAVLRRFGRGSGAGGKAGLGLGLAFVSEIARWHGGRVEIVDAPGGGACIRVRLPIAAAEVFA